MIHARMLKFLLAGAALSAALAGCSGCSKDSADKTKVESAAKAGQVRSGQEGEEDDSYAMPTGTERDMAIQLGSQLLKQGKLEEAESKLAVAAAAGSPDAERMLAKVRVEIEAKKFYLSAKVKMESGDYQGAIQDLAQVPKTSALRERAERRMEKLKSRGSAMDNALMAGVKQGLGDEDEEGEEGAEENQPEEEPPAQEEPPAEEGAQAEEAPAEEAPAEEPAE